MIRYILKVRHGKFGYVHGRNGKIACKSIEELSDKVDCFEPEEIIYAAVVKK